MKKLKDKAVLLLGHYKWHIAIVLFFTVVITIMTVQMCHKEKYDVSVMYAGDSVLGGNQSIAIQSALSNLATDVDGDGEVKPLFYSLIIMTDEELLRAYDNGASTSTLNKDVILKDTDAFNANIMSDEYVLLMLSPERYEIMSSNGALESLDALGIDLTSCEKVGEYGVLLHSIDFTKGFSAFSALSEDTVVCVKRLSELHQGKAKYEARRTEAVALFKALVEYKLPEGIMP